MTDVRICFLISPIGEKDSEIRRHADNLIRRLIVPALANLNFKIVRVDQSFANSRITDEIISYLKNSELCIVDSMQYNPNVMYELGRRHETGRPVILLRPISQQIIFDLKDIKHIEYNLDEVDSVIEVQNSIRMFLEEFERQGFISSESTVNLENISTAIGRVERRVEDVLSLLTQRSLGSGIGVSAISTNASQLIEQLGTERAFNFCIQNEYVREAEGVFAIMEPRILTSSLYFYLARLASIGSRTGFERVRDEILPVISGIPLSESKLVIGSFVTANTILNVGRESRSMLETIIKEDLIEKNRDNIDLIDRAYLVNQLGRLYTGISEHQLARVAYNDAMLLNPNESAYVYNAAGAAYSDGDQMQARKYCDKLKNIYLNDENKEDHDHLSLMYKIYNANNLGADASWALEKIAKTNPLLARILKTEEED